MTDDTTDYDVIGFAGRSNGRRVAVPRPDDYTADHDKAAAAAALRAKQTREYAAIMEALLARHDAGETLTDEQYAALTAYI